MLTFDSRYLRAMVRTFTRTNPSPSPPPTIDTPELVVDVLYVVSRQREEEARYLSVRPSVCLRSTPTSSSADRGEVV